MERFVRLSEHLGVFYLIFFEKLFLKKQALKNYSFFESGDKKKSSFLRLRHGVNTPFLDRFSQLNCKIRVKVKSESEKKSMKYKFEPFLITS